MNTIPTYTLWWIRNLAEWVRYTGDTAFAATHADYLEKTFDHVLSGMKNGQWLAGNFLDWPTKHNGEAATAGTQALALMATRDAVFLAETAKRPALAEKARAMAAELSGLRPDPHGAKSAAALLALAGLRDPKEMFSQVLGANGHAGVSSFYGYYMLEAMSAAGEDQRALDTVRDYWGAMLDMGATSFWEDFDLAWTENAFRIDELPVPGKRDIHGDFGEFCYPGFRHSLCHGWSCGPAPWCIRHILGIRPMDIGCRHVDVRPFLGDLDWAEGAMALPDGVPSMYGWKGGQTALLQQRPSSASARRLRHRLHRRAPPLRTSRRRGYLAERILKQNGFTAYNLSGGWLTWKAFHPDPLPPSGRGGMPRRGRGESSVRQTPLVFRQRLHSLRAPQERCRARGRHHEDRRRYCIMTLPELLASARIAGVKFIACDMAMGVMGITREELVEVDEVAGVAAFAELASRSSNTLFI